jgi:hypothetical protein
MSKGETSLDDESLGSDLIWGVSALAKEIGKTERQTYHLVETRQIPAGKTGGFIVASRRRLRAHFEALTSGEVA